MSNAYLKNVINRFTKKPIEVWQHVFIDGDETWMLHREQAADNYKMVFAGRPYFENFRGMQETMIVPLFQSFAVHGILVFLTTAEEFISGDIIGFAGCIPAERSEVSEFLAPNQEKLPRTIAEYMYMAELGVLEEFREQGLGKGLIASRVAAMRSSPKFSQTHLLVRTAREGSNSLPIYLKLGARVIPNLIQTMEEYGTNSEERLFLEIESERLV